MHAGMTLSLQLVHQEPCLKQVEIASRRNAMNCVSIYIYIFQIKVCEFYIQPSHIKFLLIVNMYKRLRMLHWWVWAGWTDGYGAAGITGGLCMNVFLYE